jgi:hypothetical protein
VINHNRDVFLHNINGFIRACHMLHAGDRWQVCLVQGKFGLINNLRWALFDGKG